MVKLLMIADDFTGALDSGIQFAKYGIKTQVFTEQTIEEEKLDEDTQVLVVDAESRPMSAEQAGQVVEALVLWAVKRKIPMIFKKTDSALRGNIGSELEAVSRAAGRMLYFIPAHPRIHRVTREGVHYIDGELLEKSVFGKDPFEPVTKSYIPDIIAQQSQIPVYCMSAKEAVTADGRNGITVCDAASVSEMDRRVEELIKKRENGLVAGCAALAGCFAKKLSLERTEKKEFCRTDKLFVACGSLNQITARQLDYAECNGGFLRFHLTMEQKLLKDYYETEEGKALLRKITENCYREKKVIVDTFDRDECKTEFLAQHSISRDEVRGRIAHAHGIIVKTIMEEMPDASVLLTGSDTLMGYMKLTGLKQLEPICEIEPGVVVSVLELGGRRRQVLSKSGGFGEENILCKIAEKICYCTDSTCAQ